MSQILCLLSGPVPGSSSAAPHAPIDSGDLPRYLLPALILYPYTSRAVGDVWRSKVAKNGALVVHRRPPLSYPTLVTNQLAC